MKNKDYDYDVANWMLGDEKVSNIWIVNLLKLFCPVKKKKERNKPGVSDIDESKYAL